MQIAAKYGVLHADLRVGAAVASVIPLRASHGLASRGVQLFGPGFIVTREQASALLAGSTGDSSTFDVDLSRSVIRHYRNGRDLTDRPRDVLVIDLFGLVAEDVRAKCPAIYQWLVDRVKPEREQNNRATYRDNWWIFGEPRKDLRMAIENLSRYIATVETSKHRHFQFLDASVLPDNKLIAIATADAFHLGVLSSQVHVDWTLATGSRLGAERSGLRQDPLLRNLPLPRRRHRPRARTRRSHP